ncbi:MAG: glycosyltransferase family 4 protein [Candidatus Aureabacteria bacterium]|nr:glycosyltransferase family 4 protein [Candidatus Auribacterota bacterium]
MNTRNKQEKERIRVLHIITRLIVGGAQENTIATCHRIDRSRFEVDLLTGPQLGAEGELVSTVDRRRVGFTVLPWLVRELNPLKDLMALVGIWRVIRRRRYAIVHTHSSKAGILGRIAARFAGVPVIVHTVHGWGFHDRMGRARRRSYIFLERVCGRFTDRLITVSARDTETGISLGIGVPERYVTIRSAIDIERFARTGRDAREIRKGLGMEPDIPIVGSVGRLSPQKAPQFFVKMAAKVLKSMPRINFLYVGDGPLRSEMEKMLRGLGIEERVVLAGLRPDVPELLAAMDVFVLLSLWEGLPRTVPQAMAAGLPVVASDVGGAAEVIRQGVTGFLVPPGDYRQAAEFVLRLLGDAGLRQRMGEEAKKSIPPEFSVSHMVNRIEELYVDLLRAKGICGTGRATSPALSCKR